MSTINGKTVLVTGANRGTGQALVDEALARGAGKVFAGSRRPFTHTDPRVETIPLDVTNPDQVAAASAAVDSLDLLVNNAGVFELDDATDLSVLRRMFAVNVEGTWRATQAFLPQLRRSSGSVVNAISVSAISPIPFAPSYSMSKSALWSQTVAMRTRLALDGVRVHAVFAGAIDTDMIRDLDIPKTAPEEVARNILIAVEREIEDIFPDPGSEALGGQWQSSPAKALEREFAAMAAMAAA